MTIKNIGNQIIECSRFRIFLEKYQERWLHHLFTMREIAVANNSVQSIELFCGLCAGKQAVWQAMQFPGNRLYYWHELEINPAPIDQSFQVNLSGASADWQMRKGINHIFLTISLSRAYVSAFAIAAT